MADIETVLTELPAPGCATLDVLPHPLTDEGRWLQAVPVASGTTLAAVASRAGLAPPLEVALDSRVVPPGRWHATRVAPGAIVTVRSAVADGDTDPRRTVLQISVLVASLHVGGPLGALIAIGGGLLVNALVPPRLPDAPGTAAPAAPIYTLTGVANRARPYEPLPLVLGTHRIYPDIAAAQYTEFEGAEQYLSATFHFGLGSLEITDLRIGGDPISSFADLTTEWSDAAGNLSLVSGNVDTTAGADLTTTAWVTRQAATGATKVALESRGAGVRDRG